MEANRLRRGEPPFHLLLLLLYRDTHTKKTVLRAHLFPLLETSRKQWRARLAREEVFPPRTTVSLGPELDRNLEGEKEGGLLLRYPVLKDPISRKSWDRRLLLNVNVNEGLDAPALVVASSCV